MNKTLFKKVSLQESMFSFNFKIKPDVERLAYEFEKKLNSVFEEKVIFTKVPDVAPVNIPRFVLRSRNKKLLEVSAENAVLKINYSNIEVNKGLELYKKVTTEVFNFLAKCGDINLEDFVTSQVVSFSLSDLNYPIDEDIFANVLKIQKPKNLTGVAYIINQKVMNLLINTSIESYVGLEKTIDIKDAKLSGDKMVELSSNVFAIKTRKSDMNLIDKGINIKIRISNEEILTESDIKKVFEDLIKLSVERVNSYCNDVRYEVV